MTIAYEIAAKMPIAVPSVDGSRQQADQRRKERANAAAEIIAKALAGAAHTGRE